jgi:hypothetical protein
MKRSRNHLFRPAAILSVTGLCLAALGAWIEVTPLYYAGLVLALPLYVIVLPLFIGLLAGSLTRPLWIRFYRRARQRRGSPSE